MCKSLIVVLNSFTKYDLCYKILSNSLFITHICSNYLNNKKKLGVYLKLNLNCTQILFVLSLK